MNVHVIIPTVHGRGAKLERTLAAYARTWMPEGVTSLSVEQRWDYPTCGEAWTLATDELYADLPNPDRCIVHFGADDLTPDAGWLVAAMETMREPGYLPAPLVRRPDGSVESAGQWLVDMGGGAETTACMVPIFPLLAWRDFGPIPPIHYHSDNYFSAAITHRCGYRFRVNHEYAFTHDMNLRDAGRITPGNAHDSELYEAAMTALYATPPYRGASSGD